METPKPEEGVVNEVMELLAIKESVNNHLHLSDRHGSKICMLPVGCWQAKVLAQTESIGQATGPNDLRELMQDPQVKIVFIPDSAIMTAAALETICVESSLTKVVIWENGTASA